MEENKPKTLKELLEEAFANAKPRQETIIYMSLENQKKFDEIIKASFDKNNQPPPSQEQN